MNFNARKFQYLIRVRSPKKAASQESKKNIPRKHITHKAIRWQKMLDEVGVASPRELAQNQGLTRAKDYANYELAEAGG
jgi:hypothetical protein